MFGQAAKQSKDQQSHAPNNAFLTACAAAGAAMLGGMGAMPGLPLPPNFEKLLQQGGLASLPLPPGMTNGSLSSGLPPSKRHLPPDAQVWHTTRFCGLC